MNYEGLHPSQWLHIYWNPSNVFFFLEGCLVRQKAWRINFFHFVKRGRGMFGVWLTDGIHRTCCPSMHVAKSYGGDRDKTRVPGHRHTCPSPFSHCIRFLLSFDKQNNFLLYLPIWGEKKKFFIHIKKNMCL